MILKNEYIEYAKAGEALEANPNDKTAKNEISDDVCHSVSSARI